MAYSIITGINFSFSCNHNTKKLIILDCRIERLEHIRLQIYIQLTRNQSVI